MTSAIPDKDPQTHLVIGAAMAVHRELGPGFLESVYAEALGFELNALSVPFKTEVPIAVYYKGHRLQTSFRLDLVCFDGIIVELKATPVLANSSITQLLNYLKATRIHRGLLINFGSRTLQYKRFVW